MIDVQLEKVLTELDNNTNLTYDVKDECKESLRTNLDYLECNYIGRRVRTGTSKARFEPEIWNPIQNCLEGRGGQKYLETWLMCDNCHKIQNSKYAENPYTAELLPATKLSSDIEARINNILEKEKADAGKVDIGIIFSGDKTVEVQPGMKRRFVDAGEMCQTFPYRARSILVFEKIDKVDVCFFAMQVQEYGSDVPMPNTRRVYIAYLNSVHFFPAKAPMNSCILPDNTQLPGLCPDDWLL
jgi:hypothetical protein